MAGLTGVAVALVGAVASRFFLAKFSELVDRCVLAPGGAVLTSSRCKQSQQFWVVNDLRSSTGRQVASNAAESPRARVRPHASIHH